MGQRKSKTLRNSYDISPVVSDTDFKYEQSKKINISLAKETKEKMTIKMRKEETLTIVNEDVKPIVPAWVQKEYFLDVIKEHNSDFEKIIKFETKPALSPGENYATLMLAVNFDIKLKDNTNQNIRYMLKVPHEHQEANQMFPFEPENIMYFEVIPELEAMYRDSDGHKTVCFAPKVFRFTKQPPTETVLLEDLRVYNFKNADRLDGLNMEHTKLVLKKLSQFHAASACRVTLKGPYREELKIALYREDCRPLIKAMIMPLLKLFFDNMKHFKNGDFFYELLKNNSDSLFDQFESFLKPKPDEFNVLNHGDFWCNNILFQYGSDNKLLDVRFVDFQGPRFGPPVQDLYYFLISSTNIEIKLSHFDYLVRYYHDNLVENLKLLKYSKKIPTLRELHIQLLQYSPYAIMTAALTLPMVLLEPTETANFDNFMSSHDEGLKFKNLMFSNNRYRDQINRILPWLYNRGLLDNYTFEQMPELTQDAEQIEATLNRNKPTKANSTITISTNNVPDWISDTYFVDILNEDIDDFKEISHFQVNAAKLSSDNYSSQFFKVDIAVKTHSTDSKQAKSFMLKTSPKGEQTQKLLKIFNSFERETIMYDQIINGLEKLYENVGLKITFGPKSFRFSKKPPYETIVLENLNSQGFRNVDCMAGLDMQHTKAVLSKLAAFHAASAYYFENKGQFPEALMKTIYTEESLTTFDQMVQSCCRTFCEGMQNHEGSEEYRDKISHEKVHFHDMMLKTSKIDLQGFNVLNHGGCSTNNIMFQYDEESGKLKNTYFIDFQMTKYGPPAQDLYFFLLTSTCWDIKLKQFDYFIRYYSEQLTKNLLLLNYQKCVPCLKELHLDLFKYGAWGFYTVVSAMSDILLGSTEETNLDNMMCDNETGMALKRRMFSNQLYREHAEVILIWLNRRGLLDFE